MSSIDESEYDDPPADRSRRRAQAARPAWDAATYGRPDDTRRPRERPPPVDRPAADDPEHAARTYPAADTYRASSLLDSARLDSVLTDSRSPDSRPPDPGSPGYPAPDYSTADYSTAESSAREYSAPELSYRTGTVDYLAAPSADQHVPYLDPPAPRPGSTETVSVDAYPGGLSGDDPRPRGPSSRRGRASGRNLPAAIGVGIGLAAIAVASLVLWRPAFLVVIVVAVGVAIWELVRAIQMSGANPPLVPLVAGGALMACLAWWGQTDALTFGLVVTVLAVMVWRLADGVGDYGRDVYAAVLVAVYVPFLAGFAALLATSPDGHLRVLVMLAGVVLSDTGGYLVGVRFGRHPMAPSVSPKKTWEGLLGSLVATSLGGAVLLTLLFGVAPWWGAVFGLGVSAASILGDLGESMLKRDLGVKDMSGLLPGHGGLMDRLDSIVFAAPAAYALFVLIAPSS